MWDLPRIAAVGSRSPQPSRGATNVEWQRGSLARQPRGQEVGFGNRYTRGVSGQTA